jgi:hypothetical protein
MKRTKEVKGFITKEEIIKKHQSPLGAQQLKIIKSVYLKR